MSAANNTRSLVLLTLLAAAGAGNAQSGGVFDLGWSSIDGGGQTSQGGQFKLAGVVGQPDVGVASGGLFGLSGGFLQDANYFSLPVTLSALQLD
jgi:hypothetical protein